MMDTTDDRYYSQEQNLFYEELACIKKTYDPYNLFQITFPVDPNDCDDGNNIISTEYYTSMDNSMDNSEGPGIGDGVDGLRYFISFTMVTLVYMYFM